LSDHRRCNVEVLRIKSFNKSIQSKIVEPATYRISLYHKLEVLRHLVLRGGS